MAAFDLRNNDQSGQLRGLSGGSVRWVHLDDANSFYNFRLREHYTDDDIATNPMRLWVASDHPDAEGLRSHIADALTEGQRFTDVMIVLSNDDYEVGFEEDPEFDKTVTRHLREAYETFLAGTSVRPGDRPLGVRIVRDGSPEVGGMDRALLEGQFITAILPNMYTGAGPASRPILALHVNVPDAWQGYREVGRLYSDQALYTIGNHWLDNFSHPELAEGALYRLERDADGAFFHIINPDLQDRYQLTSTNQDGVSVITLATRSGHPLAYIVLSVLDTMEVEADEAPVPAPRPSKPVRPGGKPEPDLSFDEPAAKPAAASKPRSRGSKTIIPEAQQERIFTLQERGALLQKVHFSAFMLGYDVYLGHRGELGTVVEKPAATFQVRKKTVSLLANADNVTMDGERLPQGESRLIEGDAIIQLGNQRLEYRELRGVDAEGWPYVGEIRRPASSTYMLWGRDYTIGRSRDSRVVLPDEPRNDNIVWKPKVSDGATIKSKTGEIPKSRFYTDSIMVASEHAAIELLDEVPYLSCHARHCYTYVRRDGQVLPLFPTQSGEGTTRTALEPGDEILIGNILFHVGFVQGDDNRSGAPAPAPRMSADSLVDAVSSPSYAAAPSFEAPPAASDEPKLDFDEPKLDFDEPKLDFDEPKLDFDDEDPAPPAVFTAADGPGPVDPGNLPAFEVDDDEDDEDDQAAFLAPPKDDPTTRPTVLMSARHDPFGDDDDEPSAEAPALEAPPAPRVPAAKPPPAPAPAPAPTPAAPPASARTPTSAVTPVDGDVAIVDDADAQFELGRPARLVQVGWAVNGAARCGNHHGADMVIPENRIEPGQAFEPTTYFDLRIRGRRSALTVMSRHDVRVDGDAPDPTYDGLDDRVISVIRRDEEGEEDFTVDLRVQADAALPDPRARLVVIDVDEPLAVALVTRGFPVKEPRTLTLNGLTTTGTFDGTHLELSDYLDSYRLDAGFLPFFVQNAGGRFVTAPEDGQPVRLASGDRLVVDGAVYRFDVI